MEKILSEEALSRFRQLTAEAQHIVICAHVNPDGDALGSSLAMKKYLSREGKDVQVVVPTSFPDFLRWLPGATEVKVYARHEAEVADVVKAAEQAGIREQVKIMIGGAPVTDEYCAQIGADKYTPDAASAASAAVELCQQLQK